MAGPYHEFQLLAAERRQRSNYMKPMRGPHIVQVHDDLIGYVRDTLNWVPTFNPAKKEGHRGLCRYGVTVIDGEGASKFALVLDAWASLFACGPKDLTLTGDYILK